MTYDNLYNLILPICIFVYFALKDWLVSEKILGVLSENTKIISTMVGHCMERRGGK